MNLYDYSMPVCLATGRPAERNLIALKSDCTVIYTWNNFETIGSHHDHLPVRHGWRRFHAFLCENLLYPKMGPTDLALTKNGDLLIDPWGDGWRWGRARTIYDPHVFAAVRELLHRNVLSPASNAFFGNWASGEIYEALGYASDVTSFVPSPDAQLVLWHGTSTERLKVIKKEGLNINSIRSNQGKKGKVYFSGSRFRASYFARQAMLKDRKRLERQARDQVRPVVLRVEFRAGDYDLCPDEDYLQCLHHEQTAFEGTDLQKAWHSLMEFGQVAVNGSLPASSVTDWIEDYERYQERLNDDA
jgi:hypothetical protein